MPQLPPLRRVGGWARGVVTQPSSRILVARFAPGRPAVASPLAAMRRVHAMPVPTTPAAMTGASVVVFAMTGRFRQEQLEANCAAKPRENGAGLLHLGPTLRLFRGGYLLTSRWCDRTRGKFRPWLM